MLAGGLNWFAAVDQCQALLDDTTATLAELNAVLLHDANQMQGLLQDIEHLASGQGGVDAEEAIQRVSEQVDRVAPSILNNHSRVPHPASTFSG